MVSMRQESGFRSLFFLDLIYINSDQQRRIELLLELAICFGIPIGAAILCK